MSQKREEPVLCCLVFGGHQIDVGRPPNLRRRTTDVEIGDGKDSRCRDWRREGRGEERELTSEAAGANDLLESVGGGGQMQWLPAVSLLESDDGGGKTQRSVTMRKWRGKRLNIGGHG